MPAAPLRRGMEGGKEHPCTYYNRPYEGWLCFAPTMGITARTPIVIGMAISHRWKSRSVTVPFMCLRVNFHSADSASVVGLRQGRSRERCSSRENYSADGATRQQRVRVGLAWGESISILEGMTDSTPVSLSGHGGCRTGCGLWLSNRQQRIKEGNHAWI